MRSALTRFAIGVVGASVCAASPVVSAAQLPIESGSGFGQSVTPAYEGWYRNFDGSYSLSFGYFNRNFEEVLEASVGRPLALTVWASDDGRAVPSIASAGRENVPVTLTWFKHQGPGAVTFSEASPRVSEGDGKATTTATFSAPGRYVLRVRANDASGIENAGHAQCCWTNAFLRVVVSR